MLKEIAIPRVPQLDSRIRVSMATADLLLLPLNGLVQLVELRAAREIDK